MALNRGQLTEWLDAYFEAWRSNDGMEVAKLFSEGAVYSYGPFREPARGRDQIVANWIADGAPLTAESRYEILATGDDLGVVHWNVRQKAFSFHEPTLELDGILALRFNEAGECVEHLEWFDTRTIEQPPPPSPVPG